VDTRNPRTYSTETRSKELYDLIQSLVAYTLAAGLPAQSIFGTFTGIVFDPSQAVVAGASVRLRDERSGSRRETKTNYEGYDTFAHPRTVAIPLPDGISRDC